MSNQRRSFRSRIGSARYGDLFIEVPFDVRAVFGRARPPVHATVNGYRYRSRLSVYDDQYLLPMRKSHRDAAGLSVGKAVRVTVEPDQDERTVELPPDLAALLRRSAPRRAAWERLSHTRRQELAGAISGAKRPETRARRFAELSRRLDTL